MKALAVVAVGAPALVVLVRLFPGAPPACGNSRTALWDFVSAAEDSLLPDETVDVQLREGPDPIGDFVCESVRVELDLSDQISPEWLRLRRAESGVMEHKLVNRILRDDDEFVGENPMRFEDRFIYVDDCLALSGRHRRINDTRVLGEMNDLWREMRESVSCRD